MNALPNTLSVLATTKVEEWMDTFERDTNIPLQLNLVREELAEFQEAVERGMNGPNAAELLKEAADVIFVIAGLFIMGHRDFETLEAQDPEEFDALMNEVEAFIAVLDRIKEKNSIFTELLKEAFVRTCASNMSKLDDEGKPIFNDEGKILKGPNYQPPDLSDLGARLFASMNTKKK